MATIIHHYKYTKRADNGKLFRNKNDGTTFRVLRYDNDEQIKDFDEVQMITEVIWNAPTNEK